MTVVILTKNPIINNQYCCNFQNQFQKELSSNSSNKHIFEQPIPYCVNALKKSVYNNITSP